MPSKQMLIPKQACSVCEICKDRGQSSMEVRLLNGNEIQWAVQTANEVFEYCDRNCVKSQDEIRQHYDYVRPEVLWQEQNAGRLILWGAFENGQMCAVSAMQNVGHITMLYVRPPYQRRGLGSWLLNEMRGFADHVLHLPRVAVNVTPVAYAPFFYRRGFQMIPGMPFNTPYVSLEQPLVNSMMQKNISTKAILLVTAVTLLLCFGVGVIVTVLHMMG